MNGLLVALVAFLLFDTAKCHTAQPAGVIEVQEGGDVTIRCQTHPTINLENYTLDVKRVDGNSGDSTRVVYSRRHGKEHPIQQTKQYRNRVFVIKEDLKIGFVTVVIRSVQRSDSGQYKCYIPKLKKASLFSIDVKREQNRTKENDFSTTATLMEEMTDAGETGAATKKYNRHHVITIIILCLFVGGVFVVP